MWDSLPELVHCSLHWISGCWHLLIGSVNSWLCHVLLLFVMAVFVVFRSPTVLSKMGHGTVKIQALSHTTLTLPCKDCEWLMHQKLFIRYNLWRASFLMTKLICSFKKKMSNLCKLWTWSHIFTTMAEALVYSNFSPFFNLLLKVPDQASEPWLNIWSFSQQLPYPFPWASRPLRSPSSGNSLQWPRCVSKQSGCEMAEICRQPSLPPFPPSPFSLQSVCSTFHH